MADEESTAKAEESSQEVGEVSEGVMGEESSQEGTIGGVEWDFNVVPKYQTSICSRITAQAHLSGGESQGSTAVLFVLPRSVRNEGTHAQSRPIDGIRI